jgi:hypothetical protein
MAAPRISSTCTVREIAPGESLRDFIDLSWTINAGDPSWVAPLRMTVEAALDRKKHPFHAHSEVAYFLAEKRGTPVGRIAAIHNRRHNDFHEDTVGFFGLFECVNDPEVAGALFDAAGGWLAKRGLTTMRGPTNFSTNEEVASPGVLIEGFETPPFLMMTHNPSYYADLHAAAGFDKAKDVLAFLMDRPDEPPQRGMQIIDRILEREGVTVRPIDLKHFRRDVDKLKTVYNAAWVKNWGFVPMTDAEFEHLAKEFRPFVEPDLCLLAEQNGEPVGFYLGLPNLNEAIRHVPNGRLLPFGWVKLLWHKRKVRTMRVLTVGFKPHLHRAGLGPAFYGRAWASCVKLGFIGGEASWILEENLEMVRALERMGAIAYKRYRIYERPL